MPFIVATYVYASSQGQRTHSARTNYDDYQARPIVIPAPTISTMITPVNPVTNPAPKKPGETTLKHYILLPEMSAHQKCPPTNRKPGRAAPEIVTIFTPAIPVTNPPPTMKPSETAPNAAGLKYTEYKHNNELGLQRCDDDLTDISEDNDKVSNKCDEDPDRGGEKEKSLSENGLIDVEDQELTDCDDDLYIDENKDVEKDSNFNDFRTMPRMMMKSSMKAGVKRLQVGPKKAKKMLDHRTLTGKTLRRLIDRLRTEIPEVRIGEETRRKQNLERKVMQKEKPSSSQEEDCLTLLSGMSLYQGGRPGGESRVEPETISKLSELRIMENNLKSAMNKEKLEEPEKPENARGMVEDQWQDFSDSEEEMEALELLTRAEEALMLE